MSLFKQLKRVHEAHERVAIHRDAVAVPAAALLERGYRHPLATVGTAAGAGFVLGALGVGPMRVPGLTSLLSGGVAEIMAQGMRMLAEMGMDGSANDDDDSDAA
jgi:hypothetical protein